MEDQRTNFWKAPQDRRVLIFVMRAKRLRVGGGTAIPDEIRYHVEPLTQRHSFDVATAAGYHKHVLSAHPGAWARIRSSPRRVVRALRVFLQRHSDTGSPLLNFPPARLQLNSRQQTTRSRARQKTSR